MSASDRLFFTSFFNLKLDTSSVDILPLTIDEGSYMALSCNALPQPDVGEIVFAFWGQLSHLHGLEAIFSAFTQAYLEDKRIRLYVFDSDKERIDASKSIACNYENSEYCLHHVHGNWGSHFNNGLYSWLQLNCRFSIGPMGFTRQGLSTIPNKQIESWILKIPMISQKNNVLADNSLLYVPVCRPSELKEKILYCSMQMSSVDRSLIAVEGYKYYSKNHSSKAFFNLLERLLNNCP